jgi:hypothetical protein
MLSTKTNITFQIGRGEPLKLLLLHDGELLHELNVREVNQTRNHTGVHRREFFHGCTLLLFQRLKHTFRTLSKHFTTKTKNNANQNKNTISRENTHKREHDRKEQSRTCKHEPRNKAQLERHKPRSTQQSKRQREEKERKREEEEINSPILLDVGQELAEKRQQFRIIDEIARILVLPHLQQVEHTKLNGKLHLGLVLGENI